MDYTVNEELLDRIHKAWGTIAQFHMMMEESGELITVLNHFMRNRTTPQKVVEELVDVENMISQLKFIFREYSEEFDRVKTQKLIRTEKLLGSKPKNI